MLRITFYVPYLPGAEEKLYLRWFTENEEGCTPLFYHEGGNLWHVDLILTDSLTTLQWNYLLSRASGTCEEELSKRRLIFNSSHSLERMQIFDFWRPPGDLLHVFERRPFREVLFYQKRDTPQAINEEPDGTLIIRLPAPAIAPGLNVYLVGEPESLGSWDPSRALPLIPVEYPYWEIRLRPPWPNNFQYKYLIGKKGEGHLEWEKGQNRHFIARPDGGLTILNDYHLHPPHGLPRWAGLIVPVFSLRSRQGLGVGEFLDLIPFLSWAKEAGFRIVQLLPINDTHTLGTWSDSYPYSVISTCALHPIYLNLDDLLARHDPLQKKIRTEKIRLNRLMHVNYPEVMRVKLSLLKQIFRASAPSFLADPQVNTFLEENASWLKPYAAYSFLMAQHRGRSFNRSSSCAVETEEIIAMLNDPSGEHYRNVAFYYFIQYHLHRQLSRVTQHAQSLGIVLKGDLPIGVSPLSVERWSHPEWFDVRYTIGAPPDDFSEKGQMWGFPLYNWEEMEKDHYQFWKTRLRHLANFFHAIRLDHVLGFFRLWAVPRENETALRGFFTPSLPYSEEELISFGLDTPDELSQPLIDDGLLYKLFGRRYRKIANQYLEARGSTYVLSSPPEKLRTKRGNVAKLLLELQDEVILLKEEKNGQILYHPRLGLEKTYHFSRLPEGKKEGLINLNHDYFYRRNNQLWQEVGTKRLSLLLKLTDLLLCAEDLGLVPDVVPPTLTHLGLLSLRIERMPTRLGEIFASPSNYPYLSVASPGTHDMPPLRLWWREEDRAKIQYYYEHILGEEGIAPKECTEGIIEKIVTRHLFAPSMFALFLTPDIFALDSTLTSRDPATERINNPTISDYHWNYRQHLHVEDLLNKNDFKLKIRTIIARAGRNV
ncbi:MAG: 4-alpha-glucanotransferase [Syntrophales bacterium]|nr:4-alpha-glucanotransferase [Syntrophales bacterium]